MRTHRLNQAEFQSNDWYLNSLEIMARYDNNKIIIWDKSFYVVKRNYEIN